MIKVNLQEDVAWTTFEAQEETQVHCGYRHDDDDDLRDYDGDDDDDEEDVDDDDDK